MTEKEGETTNALYEIETTSAPPVWLLCNVPATTTAANPAGSAPSTPGGTRSAPSFSENREERRKSEMPEPWYTMTATEIYPIALNDRVSHEALAFTTAQLCHQTMYWSGRAAIPCALHAAIQMDEDHPQYRRNRTISRRGS